ncbi:fibrillarin-like rRNA/tRNA 2'-O-methyltransferase [Candidatus Woesearchaeota archaeon]|nr:fibrillarin-like rRNA/tRNA 2'-O-methyltransferase [Candidatus Woesearchaeota archaeon]
MISIDPKLSKLGAALKKSITLPLKPTDVILYLGASTGTTTAFLSDMVPQGFIFALELSRKMFLKLFELASHRQNIGPILADASFPETYAREISDVGQVDVIYQDVSQRHQVDIFLKNCKRFLKTNGTGILFVKARSIDVRQEPQQVFLEAEQRLAQVMKIVQKTTLEPYQKDHMVFVCCNGP